MLSFGRAHEVLSEGPLRSPIPSTSLPAFISCVRLLRIFRSPPRDQFGRFPPTCSMSKTFVIVSLCFLLLFLLCLTRYRILTIRRLLTSVFLVSASYSHLRIAFPFCEFVLRRRPALSGPCTPFAFSSSGSSSNWETHFSPPSRRRVRSSA